MNTRSIIQGSLALAATSVALLAFGCSSDSSGGPNAAGDGGSPATTASTTSSTTATTGTGDTGGGGSNAGAGGASAGGGGGVAVNNDDYVYPADSTTDGQTYAQYAADWWTWALSIEGNMNPVIDDGPCDQAQPADVFFLAGNTGGTVTRSCTVPATKPLFFPILNTFSMACTETVTDCADATGQHMIDNANAAYSTPPISMQVEIDGASLTDLEQYYAVTAEFDDPRESDDPDQPFATDCTGPVRANSCGVAVGSPRPLAGSGYWILMKPLTVGSHVVHFQGRVPGFSLNVTYNLTVQ
jgi:hypothetical protein